MAAVSLSVSTVKPLGDRVFVKVNASEEKTAGGLYLPDTAKERPQVGEVVSVGDGKVKDDGSRQSVDVKVGDNHEDMDLDQVKDVFGRHVDVKVLDMTKWKLPEYEDLDTRIPKLLTKYGITHPFPKHSSPS